MLYHRNVLQFWMVGMTIITGVLGGEFRSSCKNGTGQCDSQVSSCFILPGHLNECFDVRDESMCGKEVQKRENHISCCGSLMDGTFYNDQEEKCCNGKLFPAADNEDCCGNKIFSTAEQLCCAGVIHNLTVSHKEDREYRWAEQHCCGRGIYNISSEVCCTNDTAPSISDVKRKEFNANRETLYSCCPTPEGKIKVVFAKDEKEGHGSDLCFSHQTAKRTCEKGSTFDISPSEICCDGTTLNAAQQGCCGGIPHNQTGHICCFDKIHVIQVSSHNPVCCANAEKGYVDSDKEICCDGQNLPRQYGSGTRCCGRTIIDSKTMDCCGNNIMSFSYEREKEYCCGGQVLSKRDKINRCCGGKVIDTNYQVCCEHSGPENKTNEDHDSCCENGIIRSTFNSKNERCNHMTGMPYSKTCQNHQRGDSYICCNNQQHYNGQNKFNGCCGSQPMHPHNSVCCNGTVQHVSGSLFMCDENTGTLVRKDCPADKERCGSACYNPVRNICCKNDATGEAVVHWKLGGDTCCGLQNYFSWSEYCVQGKVQKSCDISDKICKKGLKKYFARIGIKGQATIEVKRKQCGIEMIHKKRQEEVLCELKENNYTVKRFTQKEWKPLRKQMQKETKAQQEEMILTKLFDNATVIKRKRIYLFPSEEFQKLKTYLPRNKTKQNAKRRNRKSRRKQKQ